MSEYTGQINIEAIAEIPEWLQGPQGPAGPAGKDGITPVKGVDYWTESDKQEIIEAAKQEVAEGAQGKSAYEVALDNGFVGTEQDWLASLVGPAGEIGPVGPQGVPGVPGKDGEQGLPGRDGIDGKPGKDGISPTATVESNSEGAVITITDATGTTTAQVYNGSNGLPGADGRDGRDGFSPTIEVTDTETGVLLTITDSTGTKTATVSDGVAGPQGPQGEPGIQGEKGDPFTYADFTEEQLSALTGPQGPAGKDGVNGQDGHTPVRGTDYWTENDKQEIITEAASAVNVPVATTTTAGKVKPDGTTITVDADGTIHSAGGGGGGSSYTFTNGLTETNGTVSWDLNDRIKLDNNNNATLGLSEEFYIQNDQSVKNNFLFGTTNSTGKNIEVYKSDNQYWPNNSNLVFGNVSTYNGKNGSISINGEGQKGTLLFGSVRGGGKIITQGNSYGGGSIVFGYSQGADIIADNTSSGSIVGGNANDSKNCNISSNSYGAFVQGCTRYCKIAVSSTSMGGFARGYADKGDIIANGVASHAEGDGVQAKGAYQFVNGICNILDSGEAYTKGTYVRIVGNGASTSSRSNAYTLDWSGNATFAGTVSSAGADYAEFFEWKDGNTEAEDRVGYIVTLDGDKIKLASSDDDILGIISGTATVLGDNAEWYWNKRWLTDDFGRTIYEDYDVEHEEVKDENTGEVIMEAWTEHIHAPKTNPAYDPDKPYINRRNRPEWSAVGMMGKLYVRDDGTAQVNSYVTAKDGIATHSDSKTNMRVMKRVKDNIILVCLK